MAKVVSRMNSASNSVQPPDVGAGDEFHLQSDRRRRLLEFAQGVGVRRRLRIVRIVKDRQIVARSRAPALESPPAEKIVAGGFDHEFLVLRRYVAGGDGTHAADAPLIAMTLETRPQQRRLQQVEELPAQGVVAAGDVAPKIDAQLEDVGLDRRQRALHQFVQPLGDEPHQVLRLQVLDRRHARQRLVPARLGQQRDVVAEALVAVGLAQVEDLDAAVFAVGRIGEIGSRRNHAHAGNLERPVVGIANDDEDAHAALAVPVADGSPAGWRRGSRCPAGRRRARGRC